VPLVVLDPVVLVNTAKVPDGLSAKLLTLLAYGRALGYLNHDANSEAQAMEQWRPGTPLDLKHGWASMHSDPYTNTFIARQTLARAIPAQGRCFDCRLAISNALLERVVRRVGKLRETESVELDAGVVSAAVSVHAARWIREDWTSVPNYTDTGHTDANVSIHTALRAGAPLIITKSADACDAGSPRMYTGLGPDEDYPLGVTAAVHFDLLVGAFGQEFDFNAIEASVLEQIAPSGSQRPS
jgi:hypothetical protein